MELRIPEQKFENKTNIRFESDLYSIRIASEVIRISSTAAGP